MISGRYNNRSIPEEVATHLSDFEDYDLCSRYGLRADRMAMKSPVISAMGLWECDKVEYIYI